MTTTTNTVVSGIVPPRVRAAVYVVSAMLAAAWGVIEAHVTIGWPWMAGYAAWNAGVGLLAVSNTAARPPQEA